MTYAPDIRLVFHDAPLVYRDVFVARVSVIADFDGTAEDWVAARIWVLGLDSTRDLNWVTGDLVSQLDPVEIYYKAGTPEWGMFREIEKWIYANHTETVERAFRAEMEDKA